MPGTFFSPSTWRMIWSMRGNGRRACVTSVSARSSTVRLHLVNLYAEPLGNAAVPQKFQQAKPKPAAEKPARRNVGWIAALAVIAILAAGAAYYFTAHRSKGAAIPEKSIAVLPMVNSTGDPANEYFSDGNVWSDTYDRELKDIFAVQSEIAGAVAKQLKVALLGNNGQTAHLTTTATPSNQNVEAYNALLQGNFYYNRFTAEDTRKAIGCYEEAIRLGPCSAVAYAKLSMNALNLATNYAGLATKEREESLAKAHALAKRALELDPNLADAHLAQGRILEYFDFNFAAVEAELRRAFELAPHDATVTSSLASLLFILGRLDEAVAIGQRAIALEPLRAASHFTLGRYLTALSRYGEAEAAVRKAVELQPQSANHYTSLSQIQILRGKPGAAVELAKQETDPFWRNLRTGAGPLCQRRPGRGRRGAEKTDRRKRRRRRQPDRPGLCPAQGAGEDVRVAGARLDHTRRRRDPDAGRSFPARLQGRPALHRLCPKDRRDAEIRCHAMSAGEREPRMNAN